MLERHDRKVDRSSALFAVERDINGLSAAERRAVRQEESKPLLSDMEEWLRAERAGLSRSSPVAGPIDYMLSRWADFARYADDGRICNSSDRCRPSSVKTSDVDLFTGSAIRPFW